MIQQAYTNVERLTQKSLIWGMMVLFLMCTIATLLVKRSASLASVSQPWPIKIDKIASCCMYLENNGRSKFMESSTLSQCIRKRSEMDTIRVVPKGTSVAIFSLAQRDNGEYNIPNISNFTQYQVALLSSYASHNNYVFKSFDSMHDPTESDVRWNKVKLFIDSLAIVDGWARDVEYLVWIDADAIILDFNLRIETVASEYPHSDIIASADIRMGLINTGLLVVRNTPWSRIFLERWWTVADRTKVCDQDAFDLLYHQYIQSEKISPPTSPFLSITHKIQVLPMDRLNSHPPAMLHQQSHDQVLHLMGETTALRAAVFRRALTAVCDARSGGILPPQLGVNREAILKIARDVYSSDLRRLLLAANHSTSTTEHFESLSRAAHHYCDILSHLNEVQQTQDAPHRDFRGEIWSIRNDIFDITTRRVESLRDAIVMSDVRIQMLDKEMGEIKGDSNSRVYDEFLGAKGQRRDGVVSLLGMLKRAAEAGNDLFWVTPTYEGKRDVADKVFGLLEDLLFRVAESSRAVPLHMQALMHQNVGLLEYEMHAQTDQTRQKNSRDHLSSAQTSLRHSVSIFEDNSVFSPSVDASTQMEYTYSLQMLSAVTCTIANNYKIDNNLGHLGNFTEGLSLWSRTVQLARGNVKGVELGMHFENFAVVLYNAAICYHDAGKWKDAYDLLIECETVHSKVVRDKQSTAISEQQMLEVLRNDSFLVGVRALRKTITNQLIASGVSLQEFNGNNINNKPTTTTTATTASTPPRLHSLRTVHTPEGVKYIQDTDSTSRGSATLSHGEVSSEIEWEECGEDDEDCEDVIVYDDVPTTDGTKSDASPPVTLPVDYTSVKVVDEEEEVLHITSFPPDDESIFEGLTAQQREELVEIRERYALQAGRYFVNSNSRKQTQSNTTKQQQVGEKTVLGAKSSNVKTTALPQITTPQQQQQQQQSTPNAVPTSLAAVVDADVIHTQTVASTITSTLIKTPPQSTTSTPSDSAATSGSAQAVRRMQYQIKSLTLENENLKREADGLREKVKYLEALLDL